MAMADQLQTLLLLALLMVSHHAVAAFTSSPRLAGSSRSVSSRPYLNTERSARSPNGRKTWTASERDAILGRTGEYFKLDRMRGAISFGSSSRIRTTFDDADLSSVKRWLSNDEQIAMSIWDPKLIQKVEPKVYRLKLMTLMFVTIQLAPHVDVKMYTDENTGSFRLESVAFDPNVQLLPGLSVTAEQLGILIDVVGELYPSEDGNGVDGTIGFVTKGELPPPMRLLPEGALRSSLGTINRTITNFAMASFEKGARTKFREFLQEERAASVQKTQ